VRAVGYFRQDDGDSLAEQSRCFLEFCHTNGYEAAAAFLDASLTEASLPGFHQMLQFVKQQEGRGFLLVAVRSLSSLGDALTEAARRYFQLATLGVPVVSMESGEDVAPALLERWAGQRSDGRLGEKVKAAMRRKAVKGEALGRPPYGYRVGIKRRLVVVADEGSVVRYIFRLYIKDGLGIRRIARRLNEEELRTRRGGLWSMVTVRDILRNRAYVGTYTRFGVRVPASHAPLISQEDFRLVQEQLDQRRPATGARHLSPFLLSGVAYCGYCGNKMIGVTRKQKWQRRSDGEVRSAQYRYYQCESRTNRSLCDYHTRRAGQLEEEVRQALLNGDSIESLPVAGNGAAVLAETEANLLRLRNKARRLDKRLEQHLDAAAAGRINPERLRSEGVNLAVQHFELEETMAESQRLAQQQATAAERRRRCEDMLARLRSEWSRLSFQQRQDLLREILDRVIIRDDGIEVRLRP